MTSQQNEKYIYKICSIKNWKIAKQIGVFKGFEIDLIDGYIYFSSKDLEQGAGAQGSVIRQGGFFKIPIGIFS